MKVGNAVGAEGVGGDTGFEADADSTDGDRLCNEVGAEVDAKIPVEVQYLFFSEEDGCLALFGLHNSAENVVALYPEAGTEYVRW